MLRVPSPADISRRQFNEAVNESTFIWRGACESYVGAGGAEKSHLCQACAFAAPDDSEFAPPLKGAPDVKKRNGKSVYEVFN
jgi:hypothetical protein